MWCIWDSNKGREMTKTNLDKLYKADETSEKSGVWFDMSPTTAFLIKPFRSTNPAFKAALTKHFKPYARQIDNGSLDTKKETEVMAKLFCNACLVDWKGVEINGADTPYSVEAGVKLLTTLPILFEELLALSKDASNYKEDYSKEDLGNSSAAT